MNRILLFIILLFSGVDSIWAQKRTGSIKGGVSSLSDGQVIVGATVYVEGTEIGTSTNVEGEFIITSVPEGRYSLLVNMMGYKPARIEGVNVLSGNVVIVGVLMEEQGSEELEAIDITVSRPTSTEISIIREIKEAQVVSTGISAEQISRSLDTDAGQSLKRLPGVSLIDDRFIMIRGLGERYNNVLLNGALAPNTEIDTRSFSFDMIPSNAIDRMLIVKTGAADLPGDFAGAIIKVFTKNVPSRNFFNVTAQAGYRLGTTGQTLLEYQGSSTDWLGFDNGTRELPEGIPEPKINRQTLGDSRLIDISKQFSNIWLTTPYTAPPDFKGSLDFGRLFHVKDMRIGNLTTLIYQRNRLFTTIEQNRYYADSLNIKNEKGDYYNYINEQSDINTRLGALHNWSFIFNKNHKIEFRNLFNQLSLDRTTFRYGFNDADKANLRAYQLFYESRSIYSGQLSGEHQLMPSTKVNWLVGHNYINRKQPDLRRYFLRRNDTSGVYQLQSFTQVNLTNNSRFFSDLNEKAYMGSVDLQHTRAFFGKQENLTFKAGAFYEKKERNFEARWLALVQEQGKTNSFSLEEAFNPENINISGLFLDEGTRSTDSYKGESILMAFYLQASASLAQRLNMTAGVRYENNDQKLKYIDQRDNEQTSATPFTQLLPSVNLTYEVSDRSLLRAAYFRSWNRAEFREIAPFTFYDFDNEWELQGFEAREKAANTDLRTPRIENIDLRWEWYPSISELFTFGVFYKYFDSPIELIVIESQTSVPTLGFENPRSAESLGVELELRKSFPLNNKQTQLLSINTNAAYIKNTVNNSNLDKQVGSRSMMNQSPYLLNLALFFENITYSYKFGAFYNVFGPRLFYASEQKGTFPDMYELPRHELDLVMFKSFGEHWEIKMGIQNFLNTPIRFYQDSNADGRINTSTDEKRFFFRRGQNITLSVSARF